MRWDWVSIFIYVMYSYTLTPLLVKSGLAVSLLQTAVSLFSYMECGQVLPLLEALSLLGIFSHTL